MSTKRKPKSKAILRQALAEFGTLLHVDDLVPNPRNARTHPVEQIAVIQNLIREFGFTNPFLVDVDAGGIIVAGHGRRLAVMGMLEAGEAIRLPSGKALEAGMVPAIDCSRWTEAQRRAYTLADNQSALMSAWDEDLLRLELGELKEEGYDLALTGFDAGSIDNLLNFSGTGGDGDPDAYVANTLPEFPVSQPGDMWVLGNHRLICGDATDPATVERVLDGFKPMLLVTDQPYGVDYDPTWRNRVKRRDGSLVGAKAVGLVKNDDRADWSAAWALFPGDVIYVWHGGLRSVAAAQGLMTAGFELRSQIIWNKHQFVIGRGDYHWQHEPCWYAVRKGKAGRWIGGRKQATVWTIAAPSGWAQIHEGADAHQGFHSTQKPVECMRRPMETNSKQGEAVYEPFCGSGSAIIAGELIGRRILACELIPGYVDVAVQRWQSFTGKAAVLAGGGLTYAEIERDRIKRRRTSQRRKRLEPQPA